MRERNSASLHSGKNPSKGSLPAGVMNVYLEVDGNTGIGGAPSGLFFPQNTGVDFYIPMHAVFTGLSAGSHNVQIWVSTSGFNASNVYPNPACNFEQVIVQEM